MAALSRLRTAYELAMSDFDAKSFTQEQYVLYGGYYDNTDIYNKLASLLDVQ